MQYRHKEFIKIPDERIMCIQERLVAGGLEAETWIKHYKSTWEKGCKARGVPFVVTQINGKTLDGRPETQWMIWKERRI